MAVKWARWLDSGASSGNGERQLQGLMAGTNLSGEEVRGSVTCDDGHGGIREREGGDDAREKGKRRGVRGAGLATAPLLLLDDDEEAGAGGLGCCCCGGARRGLVAALVWGTRKLRRSGVVGLVRWDNEEETRRCAGWFASDPEGNLREWRRKDDP